jgi:hypothetical protein
MAEILLKRRKTPLNPSILLQRTKNRLVARKHVFIVLRSTQDFFFFLLIWRQHLPVKDRKI